MVGEDEKGRSGRGVVAKGRKWTGAGGGSGRGGCEDGQEEEGVLE